MSGSRARVAVPVVLLAAAAVALFFAARSWRAGLEHASHAWPFECTARFRLPAGGFVELSGPAPLALGRALVGPLTTPPNAALPAACPLIADAIGLGALGAGALALAVALGRERSRARIAAVGVFWMPRSGPLPGATRGERLRFAGALIGRALLIPLLINAPGWALSKACGRAPPLEYADRPLAAIGFVLFAGVCIAVLVRRAP